MEDIEDSGVKDSDRESDNAVESEGSGASSSGAPSMTSTSADEYEDDETTYRKRFIENEEKAARRKQQISENQKSQKRLKQFCFSETLKRLVAEAIEEAFKSRVPDSSGGCSCKDFVEPAQKSDSPPFPEGNWLFPGAEG